MDVKRDAYNLLFFLHDEFKNKGRREVRAQDVFDKIGWEAKRINLAYEYLIQNGLLKGVSGSTDSKGLEGFIVQSLSPEITISTTSRPSLGGI